MKKARYLFAAVAMIMMMLCGCGKGEYRIELTDEQKAEYTAVAQDYILENFGETMTDIGGCYVTTVYAGRKQALEKRDEWTVCVYGSDDEGTVYNVHIGYDNKTVSNFDVKFS